MEASAATSNSPSASGPRSAERESQTASRKDRAETGPADGFLFPPEDLIKSVLDLTRELEKLGVIEIHTQPNGADFYRILEREQPVRRSKQPTGEIAGRIGAIFRRRRSTYWSPEEIKAFKLLWVDPGDLGIVEEYYHNMAGRENSYCRTTLLTFLRHYHGEVDRARRWKETSSRKHCY